MNNAITLSGLLENAAERETGIIFIDSENQDSFISYKNILITSKKIAYTLRQKGVQKGDNVVVSVNQSRDFVCFFWGCVFAGAIPVPVPFVYSQNQSTAFERLKNIISTFAPVNLILENKELETYLVDSTLGKILFSDDLLKHAGTHSFEPEPIHAASDETAVIQFSSGSTGTPKGVMLSHSNIISNVEMKSRVEWVTPQDKLIHWMPYYHDYGLFGNHIFSIANGITEIRIEPSAYLRNPGIWLEKTAEYRATISCGTPTGIDILIRKASLDRPSLDLSSMRSLTIGAEMIPPDLYAKLRRLLVPYRFNPDCFRPGYGMAEATLSISVCNPGKGDRTVKLDREAFANGMVEEAGSEMSSFCEFTSVGFPLEGVTWRIAEEDIPLEPMHMGEIQLKSPGVTKGYLNNPEETEKLFVDGWLKTGDMGFLDRNGALYITGRKKEMIIVNGQNFFPFDLESCILNHPGNLVEKSIFTSFYSDEEKKEVVLHFICPVQRRWTEEYMLSLTDECNKVLNRAVGFTPDYTIPVKKGNIAKTSSSKTKRKIMAEKFKAGEFINYVSNKMKNNKPDKPRNTNFVEEELTRVWKTALGTSAFSPDSDFFSLGGDSIRTMAAGAEIESVFGIKLENSFFYKYPVLQSQIDYITNRLSKQENSCENEYELLVRELIAEQLEVRPEEISVKEKFLNRVGSLAAARKIIRRLTEVFDRIGEEETEDKETIREIAAIVKKAYYTSPGKPFPLMDFQETLFYHSKSFIRNEPTGLSCYIICRTGLKGKLDIDKWDEAVNHVIRKNPLLHAVVTEEYDTPQMLVLKDFPPFRSRFSDLSDLSREEQEELLRKNDLEDHDFRFDLTSYPLLYFNVFKLAPEEYEIVIHIDHQLIDGFSLFQLVGELVSAYEQTLSGKPLIYEPEEAGTEFSDYVYIEKFRRKTRRYQKAMDFALSVFKGLPEKFSIPMDTKPSLLEKVHFNTFHTIAEPGLLERISELAKSEKGISLNSLLMAAYFKLMNLWSGQNDLIINMPVYNREQHFPTARKVVGSFLDIFPVRVQTNPGEPILSIARKIEGFVRTLLEYPISSIELSRKIAEQESLKQGSLSSIIFSNSINMLPKGISRSSEHVTLGAPHVQTGAPGTYIDLVMFTWEEQLHFDWNYVRELFKPEFIATLSDQYYSILKALAGLKDKKDELNGYTGSRLLPPNYQRLLENVNRTDHDYPLKTIQQQIKETVEAFPDKEAITCKGESLSYSEFYGKACQLAHLLKEMGVLANNRVALLMNRTADLPIAQLAILIAGGAYVPIDPTYPPHRIKYMLEDCGATILITQEMHRGLIQNTYSENIKDCIFMDSEMISLLVDYRCTGKKEIALRSEQEPEMINTPEDLIYLIYTSGSTGQPKGTMLRHRNVSNFLNYEKEAFSVTEKERFAFITSYSFDMTVTSNWLPFICGASLHILSDEETKDIELLLQFIGKRNVNFLNITPSHFSMLVNTIDLLENPVHLPSEMTIMLGAEIINVSDLNRWLALYPRHRFINEYGPTETTVASTFFPIPTSAGRCEPDVVPIGKPIYNTQVYVLNENKELCLEGVPGILYIGGAGVSKGYINKEERTRSVFIPNPLTGDDKDVVYNTGDLVKMTESGDIVFIGRKDFQVNVRGYRIELGEIESALGHIPEITECCADIQYDQNKQPTVVAFYCTRNNIRLETDYITDLLKKRIPHYMVPSVIQLIDKIPVSPNGKTDKKALPCIADQKQQYDTRTIIHPANPEEEKMAEIWKKNLGLPQISMDDNFWNIGGDSISSVRLIKELKDAGFESVKLRDLFRTPTIREMVKDDGKSKERNNMIELKVSREETARLLCFPYAAGTPGMYKDFSSQFRDGVTLLSAQYPGHGDDRPIIESIHKLGDMYLEELKTRDSRTSLFLLGYSYGGYVAYEVARQLEETGRPAAGIIMIGTTPPAYKDELMKLYTAENTVLLSEIEKKDLLNRAFLETLSDEEREAYLYELKMDTLGMINYQFSNRKLKTPLLSIVGDRDEPAIRENQSAWNDYFKEVSYKVLEGNHLLIKDNYRLLADKVKGFVNKLSVSNPNASELVSSR